MVRNLLFFGAVLLLAACGPQGSGPASGGDQSAAPKHGGTLNLRENADPFNWDISQSTSAPNLVHVMLAYDRLLDWKTGPDVAYNSNELEPGLAERWEASPDAKSFTFHLRRGAKFANSRP
jgi:peptide/nickel transport system substrate-binding protein